MDARTNPEVEVNHESSFEGKLAEFMGQAGPTLNNIPPFISLYQQTLSAFEEERSKLNAEQQCDLLNKSTNILRINEGIKTIKDYHVSISFLLTHKEEGNIEKCEIKSCGFTPKQLKEWDKQLLDISKQLTNLLAFAEKAEIKKIASTVKSVKPIRDVTSHFAKLDIRAEKEPKEIEMVRSLSKSQ